MTIIATIKRNGQTFEVSKYFARQVEKGITVRWVDTTSSYGQRLLAQAEREAS